MEHPPERQADEPLFELVEPTWVVMLTRLLCYAPILGGLATAAIVVTFLIDDWDSEKARGQWSLVIAVALTLTLGAAAIARWVLRGLDRRARVYQDRVELYERGRAETIAFVDVAAIEGCTEIGRDSVPSVTIRTRAGGHRTIRRTDDRSGMRALAVALLKAYEPWRALRSASSARASKRR